MREFFRGWRRKSGVVLLVVACGFATIWIRSLSIVDVLDFRPTRVRQLSIDSRNGVARPSFSWITEGSLEGQALLEWNAHALQHCDHSWCVLPTFVFGFWGQSGATVTRGDFLGLDIPYAFLTIAMTLLSVYLILWKPRKSVKQDA